MANYYSNKKDPIHHYFKEKFEIVSSSKEALKIIKSDELETQTNSLENRTSVFKKLIKGFDLIPEEPNENETKKNNYIIHGYLDSNRYSFSKKKKVRQERLKMLQEIQKKKKEEVLDMSKIMINFLENSKMNDIVVSGDLKKQIESIASKVNQKKMNFNFNNSHSASFRFLGNEPSEISKHNFEKRNNFFINRNNGCRTNNKHYHK